MVQITMPTVTDDDGSLVSGTRFNAALWTLLGTAINALVHDSGNSAVSPADIIGEVVDARGSEADLNTRISVSLNPDGTLKAQSSLASLSEAKSVLAARNLASNDDFSQWSAGASAAPDGFTLSGTGAAVARCGSGEADTFSFGAGQYCAKLTYGSAAAKLTEIVIASADAAKYTAVKGRSFVVGVKCKASVANQASIVVDDGATTTRGGASGNASYHSGDGTEDWLYCEHTISNSMTKLEVILEVATGGAAYFGGTVYAFAEIPPSEWPPLSAIPVATATRRGILSLETQEIVGLKELSIAPLFKPGTSSTYAARASGCFFVDTTSTNGATGAGSLVGSVPVKANTLDGTSGKVVRAVFVGRFAANGNSKTLEFYIGGTKIFTTVTQSLNDYQWRYVVEIFHTGASSQLCMMSLLMSPTNAGSAGAWYGDYATAAKDLATDLTFEMKIISGSSSGDVIYDGCFYEVLGS